jgi:hypothetical protein
MISRTMHALAYDSKNDEIVVNSPLSQAVLFFRGGANGEEAPARIIQGPQTQIQGTDYDGNDKMTFDDVNGEVYLPVAGNKVLVFSRQKGGDVPPVRVLAGPDTQIRGSTRGHAPVAVDPVHNLLIVRSNAGGGNPAALLLFDRTASGNAKPKSVIQGPKTSIGGGGSPTVNPKTGWIVSGCANGALCAWNVTDKGDVAPKWMIPVEQLTGVEPSGIALDETHKELIVTSGARNRVMTFSFPEIF